MESERRQHPRRTALFSAKYTVASGTYQDSVGNVSAGGIYISTWRPIEHGQKISLQFPVLAFDQRPSVKGTVVRSLDSGFAVMFDHPIEEGTYRKAQPTDLEIEQDQSR